MEENDMLHVCEVNGRRRTPAGHPVAQIAGGFDMEYMYRQIVGASHVTLPRTVTTYCIVRTSPKAEDGTCSPIKIHRLRAPPAVRYLLGSVAHASILFFFLKKKKLFDSSNSFQNLENNEMLETIEN